MNIQLALITIIFLVLQGCSQITQSFKESAVKTEVVVVNVAKIKAPNVIIIVADQMRRASMGFWQQDKFKGALNGNSDYVITPNLDKLANESAVFTQAIANYPLCSPFRGMLLSGLYPHHNGVTNNTRTDRPTVGLKLDITTLTESLQNAGYNTALVGKGHWQNNLPLFDKQGRYVGSEQAPGGSFIKGTRYDTFIPPGPARQGIEYWYQTIGHNHGSPTVYTNDVTISGVKEGHPYHPKRYSAVDQADVLIDYIKNTHHQRSSDRPFSILWTMDPPHSPYKKISDTDEAIFNEHYKDVDINILLNRDNVDIDKASPFAAYHFSMVTVVDREIGRIIKALKKQGLDKNTLIVFTADHGEMMGSHSLMAKNVVYEESLGIPLIVYYPDKIKPQINDLLIGVPDFMPTILGLLNLEDHIPTTLDGNNYTDHLLAPDNIQSAQKPKSSLYYGKGSELGVKTDRYTYAINGKGKLIALFDNIKDPYQLNTLMPSDIPEKEFLSLKKELGQWLVNINHPVANQKQFSDMIEYPAF